MTPQELLRSSAIELGIDLTVDQTNRFFVYLSELNKWNKKINLTSITSERDTVIKHIVDSLSYIKGFSPASGLRLLDMGSGAGFPAIPIKIVHPEISVFLVESVKKKASFLRHMIRTLDLTGTEVLDTRVEELPESFLSSIDVVTARAFADMVMALSQGAPFLKQGGLMVLSRGPDEYISEPELAKAHVTLEKRIELTLPHSEYRRAIWILRKAS